jgi:hypothetical protein
MQEKKYQIFISSTYEDLKEEREEVIKAILKLYHIPIGMEMFSAEDEEQWEIIKRTIDSSDYYILILGLKYGSKTKEGISFTQKEYEYAIEQKIPILSFHLNEDVALPGYKRDNNLFKVKNFRQIVKQNSKMSEWWSSKDELGKNVSVSLINQINNKPAVGWVRGDSQINCLKPNCFNTDISRNDIIKKYLPDMYFPLEYSLMNLITNIKLDSISSNQKACETNVFPFIEKDNIEYIPNYGYKFNGKNMLTVHSNYNFPEGKEARTFILAINPKERPKINNPMFLFAYGNRKTHKCGDGINNHDKSFGLMWGQPAPKEGVSKDFEGLGIRVFFYCEHCKEDRTSQNCDTKVLATIDKLNKWHILAVTYDGDTIKFYMGGKLIHNQQYNISTSKTSYLNIGGFVHHDEDGAIVARDANYSMNGYIREFMMLRKVLNDEEIKCLTSNIQGLIS